MSRKFLDLFAGRVRLIQFPVKTLDLRFEAFDEQGDVSDVRGGKPLESILDLSLQVSNFFIEATRQLLKLLLGFGYAPAKR